VAIPKLDRRGLLPPGRFETNWTEIRRQFCTNGVRESVLNRVMQFATSGELGQLAKGRDLWLGGSFFSDKPHPKDIDGTMLVSTDDMTNHSRLIALFFNQSAVQKETGLHIIPTFSTPSGKDFRLYFEQVGPKTAIDKGLSPTDQRGILRVVL